QKTDDAAAAGVQGAARTDAAGRTSSGAPRDGGAPEGASPYFISAVAPASLSFATALSASAFETFSSTGFGAASTGSLASFRPSWVSSRTALITLILLSPTAVRVTVNSVCSSSAGAAASPAAGPAAAATATGAAALMPSSLSSRSRASLTSRMLQLL